MISSFVITGFLGVGKSTLLINSVKKNFSDKKVAIIVNEFGDVGVDGNILNNVYSDVLEISEGCICCQLAQEFESGVIEIINKYNPEIIFVETSGVSEPFPIFLSLQNLGISVEGLMCVIDSKNFHSYKANSTAKYQIGGSNILILNKSDLVTDKQLDILKEEISEIKDQYNIKNNLTKKPIFNNYLIHTATQGRLDKNVFQNVYKIEEVVDFAKHYNEHEHKKHGVLTQQVACVSDNITFDDIDTIINTLPKNIYRLKGVVKTKDIPHPIFINYSFGSTTFEEVTNYKDKSVLIFIGDSIKEQMIKLSEQFDVLQITNSKNH